LFRIAAFLIRFPIMVLEYVGRASFYSVWYLIFFVLCIFRPFTGFMVIGAIVAIPIGIVVWEHPDAANGIPFWAFPLASIVTVGLAPRLQYLRRLVDAAGRNRPWRTLPEAVQGALRNRFGSAAASISLRRK
jgi:hypothetical protein